jgi:hypothetical protein
MRKPGFRFLWLMVLGGWLVLGATPGAAYYSPLPATASFTSNSVTRTVYDPSLQQDMGITSSFYGPDAGVVDLQQDRGVIAWIHHNGTAYFVTCCVYAPGDATFKEDTQGPFGSVSQLQVKDGVVVYLVGVQGGTSDIPDPAAMVKFAIYDAARGVWKYKDYELSSGETNFMFVIKDGVVAAKYSIPQSTCISVTLYDPQIGEWSGFGGACCGGLGGPCALMSLTISNGTVYWQFGTGPQSKMGYRDGGWRVDEITQPLAYFAATPQNAWSAPLWVWFTDMSIGAAQWDWKFGDGSTSTERSPHHTYTSGGTFTANLNINSGASNFTRYIKIYPWSALTWSAAYAAMVNQEDLDMLRQYRDEVMPGTTSGRHYRTEIYNNSEAALQVLLQNPELLVTLRKLFLANRDVISEVAGGREGVIKNFGGIDKFLKKFGEKSPPALRALTDNLREEMRQQRKQRENFMGFRLRR